MDDLPEVNDGDMAARIAEHVDATGEQVATCLTIEKEFMAAVAWEVYVVESALLCGEDPRSML